MTHDQGWLLPLALSITLCACGCSGESGAKSWTAPGAQPEPRVPGGGAVAEPDSGDPSSPSTDLDTDDTDPLVPLDARELRASVQDELFWSPAVDSTAIKVEADAEGVVTLTGEVRSERERDAAESNAHEGGARRVVNMLRVTDHPTAPE